MGKIEIKKEPEAVPASQAILMFRYQQLITEFKKKTANKRE